MSTADLLSDFIVATCAICLVLAAYALRVRHSAGALPFAALMIAGALYAFGFAHEIAAQTPSEAASWLRFEYLGIPWLGITWYLTAVAQTGRQNRVPRWLLPAAAVMALAMTVAAFTDPRHHWFYASAYHVRTAGIMVLHMRPGALYWLNLLVINGFILAGLLELVRSWWLAPEPMRRLRLLVMLASLFPWLAHVAYRLGLTPLGLDFAPMGFSLAGVTFALGILRGHLLDLVPVAHDAVIAALPDPVLVFDPRERLVEFNEAAAMAFPRLAPDIIGSSPQEVFVNYPQLFQLYNRRGGFVEKAPGLSAERSMTLWPGADRFRSFEAAEVDITTRSGLRRFRPRISLVHNHGGRLIGTTVLLMDITEEYQLREQLTEEATHDALTGLINRRHLLELAYHELARARRHKRPMACVLIDADHFKRVNDTYGHPAGDAVLVEVARRIRSCLRNTDHCGRFGGEEFLLLLPETDEPGACAMAERIREHISETPVTYEQHAISVTLSAGVAAVDETLLTVDELIAHADAALYVAKDEGRNCIRTFKDPGEPAPSTAVHVSGAGARPAGAPRR